MLLVVLAALIGLPILEIYVIIQVGHAVGVLPTVALLLATSLTGAWLLRHEGARAWRAFTDALAARRPPHREVIDGTLILLGGTLMLVPGFVTDLLGLLCLFPPTRSLTRRILLATATRRITAAGVVRVRSRRGPAHPQDRPGHGTVIEGELDETPEPPPDHPDHHPRPPGGDQEGPR
ncbi:MAG TPA: FxsA family protein [Mycobacteriales bacterium]|nr:FxsA family protein [Mycobacteriales bacterium]